MFLRQIFDYIIYLIIVVCFPDPVKKWVILQVSEHKTLPCFRVMQLARATVITSPASGISWWPPVHGRYFELFLIDLIIFSLLSILPL